MSCRLETTYLSIFSVSADIPTPFFRSRIESANHWTGRNEAYNYFVLNLPGTNGTLYNDDNGAVVVKAGYLLRNASISGSDLYLTGDVNATTPIEVISGAPSNGSLYFNGEKLSTTTDSNGVISGSVIFNSPTYTLPTLADLDWKVIDSLPEIQPSYDDSAWTVADKTTTNNPRNLTTPTDLYAFDYGYDIGTLVYRGHFVATGSESTFSVETQGGAAFGHSIWVNSTYISSWPGADYASNYNATYNLPSLTKGASYVITAVIDTSGLEENYTPPEDESKTPRYGYQIRPSLFVP